MTVRIDGTELFAAAELLMWAAGGVLMLIAALCLYLLVRPPRRTRALPARDEGEQERLTQLAEAMEARLAVLERLAAEERAQPDRIERGEGPQLRRVK
jgi:membrane protein implicated in regulation of membrane protease activity